MEYVIYNTKTKKYLTFENGEVIIYGNKSEAQEDLRENEVLKEYK